MLCREYLNDLFDERENVELDSRYVDSRIRLVGVEGFPSVRTPAWDFYSEIRIEDFSKNIEAYTGFDLVLMIDSLEHLDKEVGLAALSSLRRNNKAVIVSVPEGYAPQGASCGNEFERHRATWTAAELEQLGGSVFLRARCSVALFQ